jgi:hypothetical protein
VRGSLRSGESVSHSDYYSLIALALPLFSHCSPTRTRTFLMLPLAVREKRCYSSPPLRNQFVIGTRKSSLVVEEKPKWRHP